MSHISHFLCLFWISFSLMILRAGRAELLKSSHGGMKFIWIKSNVIELFPKSRWFLESVINANQNSLIFGTGIDKFLEFIRSSHYRLWENWKKCLNTKIQRKWERRSAIGRPVGCRDCQSFQFVHTRVSTRHCRIRYSLLVLNQECLF